MHLKIRISPLAHFGDFRADGGYVGVGFQYPKGFEHAAVAWWGEGFTFGYTAPDGSQFYGTSYDSWPGGRNIMFVADPSTYGDGTSRVVRNTDKEVVYGSILRSVTEGARIELVHRFLFPKDKKFIILTVTIKNISRDTLSNVRYRRIWDLDIDNTVEGDTFNADVDPTKKKYMLYACETNCAALAASSSTPPIEWDVDAWDDIDTYLPGSSVYQEPFPVSGDYNVRLEWVYNTLAPGETKQIVMYFIGGDNKADLDASYAQAEASLKTPPRNSLTLPFKCLTGPAYVPFGADTFWIDQVCPSKNVLARNDGPLHPSRTGSLYIVMHCTDGKTAQAAINTFQTGIGSAQYVIGPNGEIVQMVSEQHTAGHVNNVHTWEGQTINNSNGIGIEMVGECGKDKKFQYSDVIYEAAAKLVSDIILRALNSNRTIQPNSPDPNTGIDEPDRKYILGHEEIQRQNVAVRTDPGAQWDWDRFMNMIRFEWMGQWLQGSNDIAPINELSATVISQNAREIKVRVRWKAKANGRDGFRIWRRTNEGSYNLNSPLRTMSAPLRSERTPQGDYEVEKEYTDIIRPRPPGTVQYCYSVWAWARRTANELQLGYYGGPLTEEKLRSKEVCTDLIPSAATGISSLSVDNIAVASQQHGKALKFGVTGQGIDGIFISIFDLSGREVFASGEVQGTILTWNLQNNAGQPLANGVYLYVVRVRGYNGREYVSEVRKLVILR